MAIPGRSSGSSFDDYDNAFYSRSPRDYIPSSSRDPYYVPHRHSTAEPYSNRPRKNTLTKDRPIISGGAISPARYERDRDEYGKTTTIPGKSSHIKKYSYTVDKDGSRLVDEKESRRGDYSDSERPREKRYHLTGSSNRSRDIGDGYEYTDAAGMYKDTEPRHRRRRGSVEGGSESRRPSVIDVEYPPRSSRDFPPISRALDRYNDGILRRETAPVGRELDHRTSSRDRNGTYDSYLAPVHDLAQRNARPLSTAGLPLTGEGRYGAAYERSPVDDDDPRRSRQRFKDSGVETRGFGIRSQSAAGKPEISPERKTSLDEDPRSLASAYARDALIPQPNIRDFLPPASIEDDRREREKERRREGKDRDRDYDRGLSQREKEREVELARDREREARYGDREVDRDGDYDKSDRRRDRDDYDRNYDRDYDKDRPRRTRDRANSDHLRHATTAAVAAAGLGTAAYAARAGAERRDKDKERDVSRDVPRDRDVSKDPPRDLPRDRDTPKDAPRERDRDRDTLREPKRESTRDSSRDIPREVPLSRESTRESYEGPRNAPKDRDRERDRERPRKRDDDEPDSPRRAIRREPHEREDASERSYSPNDRSGRRDNDEAKADEEYNRRLQQQQQELSQLGVADDAAGNSQSRHNSVFESGITQEPGSIDRGVSPSMSGALAVDPAAPASNGARDPRVRIVEPAKKEETPAPIRGILRKPTKIFPDHKDDIREGVAPLKEEAERKGIPLGARWTKIDRRLVNPEALDAFSERYEERLDCVIVLRVLTKEEIQKFADKTKEIRGSAPIQFHMTRLTLSSGSG